MGVVGYQFFPNNYSSTDPFDPATCTIGSASQWLKILAPSAGIFSIDTTTTEIPTVIAVYRGGTYPDLAPANLVACDINSAPDGRSLVRFPVVAGTTYSILIDGVNGATGLIYLHYSFGFPPTVIPSSAGAVVTEGGTLTLNGAVSGGTPPPLYTWYRNGGVVASTSTSSLVRNNLSANEGGVYSLVASNGLGISSNVVARVTVEIPLHLTFSATRDVSGQQFRVYGVASTGFYIQGTTNFRNWIPLYTNLVPYSPVNFLDSAAATQPRRFYRALPAP
jgi:hypothetical protein